MDLSTVTGTPIPFPVVSSTAPFHTHRVHPPALLLHSAPTPPSTTGQSPGASAQGHKFVSKEVREFLRTLPVLDSMNFVAVVQWYEEIQQNLLYFPGDPATLSGRLRDVPQANSSGALPPTSSNSYILAYKPRGRLQGPCGTKQASDPLGPNLYAQTASLLEATSVRVLCQPFRV